MYMKRDDAVRAVMTCVVVVMLTCWWSAARTGQGSGRGRVPIGQVPHWGRRQHCISEKTDGMSLSRDATLCAR